MTRYLWIAVAALSVAGCGLVKSDSTTPSTPVSNTYDYTAIGASDAIGYGSSNVCFPFTACPNGTGYVQDLGRQYQADHPSVTFALLNMGIPGAVLGPSIMTLGNSLNLSIPANFLASELPFIQTNGQLVTIFAGGNDARTVGSALQAGLGGSNIPGYIAGQASQFGADMNTLVSGVKAKSPQARVIILNLPNLAAAPFASGYSLTDKQVLQAISVAFTQQINSFAGKGASVVDLMCDPNMYQGAFFSSDGFHPDDAGYAYIESLIYAIVKGGAATSPQGSCSQMTIY